MIYSLKLPNYSFGHLTPPEDSFCVRQNLFCVADGITRDPKEPLDFRGWKVEEVLKKYPNPSGARLAADFFCQSFSSFIENKSVDEKLVRGAFIFANQEIDKLNKKNIQQIDYLANDYFACVATAGVIENDILYWGSVGDTGLTVFSKKGKRKLELKNGLEEFEKYIESTPGYWGDPERRKYIRSQFRNNPKQIIKGKCVSYGALTGEKEAEAFMEFSSVKLEKNDLVAFYSDGFRPLIERPDFFQTAYQNSSSLVDQKLVPFSLSLAKENPEKFGKERTLILYRLD